jgi:hypothetical protein
MYTQHSAVKLDVVDETRPLVAEPVNPVVVEPKKLLHP